MPIHSQGRYKLTHGDSLSYAQLRQVCHVLRNGGLCIIPSDTCYALAGLPMRRDVVSGISKALPGKQKSEIPLAFGSLAMVEKWVTLKPKDYRVIDQFCPGPITLVCKINHRRHDASKISQQLHTHGTVGVRIPDSPVERQVSIELDSPMTTCAVVDDNNSPITKYADAIDIVRAHLDTVSDEISLVSIEMRWLKYTERSTVVAVQAETTAPYKVRVYRPGVIELKEIEDTADRFGYWDIEGFT